MTGQADAAQLPRVRERYWRRLSAALLSAIAIVLMLFTLLGFAARYHWRCEQLCHFRVQYFWMLTLLAPMLLVLRRPGYATAAGLLAGVNLATIVPLYLPEAWLDRGPQPTVAAKGDVPLSVLTFNVRGSNASYAEVAAYLKQQRADIAVVLEVTPAWSHALQQLQRQYPHQQHEPRTDNFGIALISRLPWEHVETFYTSRDGVPSIRATFQRQGARWTFVGTHPVPPGSAATSAARNEQLVALADLLQTEQGPLILAGDLNVTSWSPYFSDLLHTANLRDTRQGRGVQPSWVSRIPLTHLPIDHILVSPGIVVQQRSVGPDLGSDHRPVVAELLLPAQNPPVEAPSS